MYFTTERTEGAEKRSIILQYFSFCSASLREIIFFYRNGRKGFAKSPKVKLNLPRSSLMAQRKDPSSIIL
jgi:hypothetical protein